MVAYIDRHKDRFGVEPICAVLPIAPSTYHEHKAREREPELRPERAKRDDALKPEVQRVWDENYRRGALLKPSNSRRSNGLRAPAHGGHDSGRMTDRVPAPWRTLFRPDGGQFGGRAGMLSAMASECCPP